MAVDLYAVDVFCFFHALLCSSGKTYKVILSLHQIEVGISRAAMNSLAYLSVHVGITYVLSRTASTFSFLLAQYPKSGNKGAVLKAVPSVLH